MFSYDPSPRAQAKRLHKINYQMVKDAISLDEKTIGDDKTKVIESYKKGLKSLDEALDIKFNPDDLDASAKTLIEKMRGNRKLVIDRINFLKEQQKNNSKLTRTTASKICNRLSNLTVNSIKKPKEVINQSSSNGRTLIQSKSINANKNLINKGDNIKNNPMNRPSITSPTSSLMEIKGVDKKFVEIILDSMYLPNNDINFDSISGLHNAKEALKESVLWPMLNPELFTGLRQPTRGVLFFGPPGCGKTLLAKAIASECKATFLSITASSLTSKWLGESEKLVKALFSVARHLKPCILFIDEIDSLLSERKENESEATRRLKTEMFCELDGLRSDDNDQIFVLAATNTPFSLDEAALRRFPKRIFIDLPCLGGRKELLIKLLSAHEKRNSLTNSELCEVAKLTEGYSASDIHALCKDAALQPLREIQNEDKIKKLNAHNIRKLKFSDFKSSLKKIRKSVNEESLERLRNWSNQYGDNSDSRSN